MKNIKDICTCEDIQKGTLISECGNCGGTIYWSIKDNEIAINLLKKAAKQFDKIIIDDWDLEDIINLRIECEEYLDN